MQNYSSFIQDLKKLISFKSVCSAPQPDAPFGKDVKDCLCYFLDLAKSMGFETVNYDNYCGEVIFGQGQEVGIIGHLDVVPTGLGWNTDPFELTLIDGVYYARGVSDDKTPLLSCLYALKELKDSARPVNKKFRLIVGCDEETGWRDVEYMQSKTSLPEYGFSPDGNFALSYAEKGIFVLKFSLPKLKRFHDLKGGTVVNAVCDLASVSAKDSAIDLNLIKKYGLKVEGNKIISIGKAAHGSTPHLGKNAILPLLNYMRDMGEDLDKIIDALFITECGLTDLETEQGKVTLSPNLIDENSITCDCRVPAPITNAQILSLLDKTGLSYTASSKHPPFMVEKDGLFVKTLVDAYNSVTGENAQPISIGGSTFSRAFKKGCAFGPKFPFHNDNIHDANENLPQDLLLKAYEIYKKAIFNLSTCPNL